MNYYLKSLLSFFFILSTVVLFANENASTPPDSTVNVVDKAASMYMVDEGRSFYNVGKVKDALNKFRQASVKDPSNWKASYWISKCHYALNNYGYARKYGEEARLLNESENETDPEIYFLLAQTYHRLSSLDSALLYYQWTSEKMTPKRKSELMVDIAMKQCKYAKEHSGSANYSRNRLNDGVNTGTDEYNALVSADGKTIYFTARRSNTTGGQMNPDDESFFEDIYFAQWNENLKKWDSVTNELGRVNSAGFDAISYISEDGLFALITLNNTYEDTKKGTKGSDICEIKMSNKGKWSTPKIIANKTINTSFFEGSATMTEDGNTMYFVSDRNGDKSSTDIYVVQKVGKKWGEAQALPMTINTVGRETTPFITPDGRFLFYSSDGMDGFGGYDVYVVENQGGTWGEPVNLGNGINTVDNDTHFKYIEALKKGYISGLHIIGNKASVDIFEIDLSNFVIPVK